MCTRSQDERDTSSWTNSMPINWFDRRSVGVRFLSGSGTLKLSNGRMLSFLANATDLSRDNLPDFAVDDSAFQSFAFTIIEHV